MLHLYYHGGSANHGCEAIVRSTNGILNTPMTLWSFDPIEDRNYLNNLDITIKDDQYNPIKHKSPAYLLCAIEHKLLGNDYAFTKKGHKSFLREVHRNDLCLSIGGDNYCYSGVEELGYYNRMLKKKGAKTVLWGCSVDSDVLTKEVIKDLECYDLISVRESLTYENLLKVGVNKHTVLSIDPAFLLEKATVLMPAECRNRHITGINISPLIMEYGSIVMENYIELVQYILKETDDIILLIPHVTKSNSDDRSALQKLSNKFKDNTRVIQIGDCSCTELKGYISQCNLFVGARTHACIAAYSTGVPTLAIGYSVKARGIARDLFGTDEKYVVPVQTMKTSDELLDAYRWVRNRASNIRMHLNEIIPEYKKKVLLAKEAIDNLR